MRPLGERIFVVLWTVAVTAGAVLGVFAWTELSLAFRYALEPLGGDAPRMFRKCLAFAILVLGPVAGVAVLQYLALGYASPRRLFRRS